MTAPSGWTRPKDALPERDGCTSCPGRTVPVIVSDGNFYSYAYAQRWYDEPDASPEWYQAGRDSYRVGFEVLYWHALPALPELPVTGEADDS